MLRKKKDLGGKHGLEHYNITVLDKDMNVIWTRQIELKFNDKIQLIRQAEISNEGEVFLRATVQQQKTVVDGKNRTYNSLLYKITANNKVEFQSIVLDYAFSKGGTLNFHKDGLLYVTGVYNNKEDGKSALIKRRAGIKSDGVYLAKFDSNLKQIFVKKHPFPDKFLTSLKEEFKIKKSYYLDMNAFSVKNVFLDYKNKAVILVSEYNHARGISPLHENSIIDPESDEIIITSISFDGSFNWVKCIDKSQEETEMRKEYFSLFATLNKGNLHLIFNDALTKKAEKEKGVRMKNYMTYTKYVTLNSDGEVIQESFYRNDIFKRKLHFQPKYCRRFSNGNVLLLSNSGKINRYGLLKLNEE